MGIHGLTKLLDAHAAGCFKRTKFEDFFGRRVAVDASMHIYQFMIVVGRSGEMGLTDGSGEETSHLQGMFYRTVRMLEAGIRPVYVFDGKPPVMKSEELEKRMERRSEAERSLKEAIEAGDKEAMEKFSKRTVRVTKKQNEDCQKLLELMGVPVVLAPSEAEAQCAQMCKDGLVYAVATEDMDALTFGAPRLVRHLMAAPSKEKEVTEFDYNKMLEELQLNAEAFIDLCILSGCDYCSTIRGIGGITALKLLKQHHSIENVIDALKEGPKKDKYVFDDFHYERARELFKNPEVLKKEELPALKWAPIDAEPLVDYLVKEKNFSEERVRRAVSRANASKGKSNQTRLDTFFKSTPKRKVEEKPNVDDKKTTKKKRKMEPKKSV